MTLRSQLSSGSGGPSLLFADMVPLAPSSGVVVSIGEAANPDQAEADAAWFRTVYLKEVLTPELCSAAFELRPMDASDQAVRAHLYFTDAPARS